MSDYLKWEDVEKIFGNVCSVSCEDGDYTNCGHKICDVKHLHDKLKERKVSSGDLYKYLTTVTTEGATHAWSGTTVPKQDE